MANQEWEQLKESLKKPATPEARKAASEAMKRYLEKRGVKGSSRPMLVSLKFKAPYPTAIELKDIPDEIARNPDFYELMKKVIAKEK